MIDFPLLTAEQFAEEKYDLPEVGRWHELVAGKVVNLHPPSVAHGTAVLNLSKALAEHLQKLSRGYACFELGLVVGRDPDTVRCPPLSLFAKGGLFAESDKIVTDTKPAMVFEIASTADRRRSMERRIQEYLECGIELVWVADTFEKLVRTSERDQPQQTLLETHHLDGDTFFKRSRDNRTLLSGFKFRVADVFAEPEFWTR